MRASVERRRAEEQKKQARREELFGMIGAGLFGLMVGGMFLLYSIIY